MQTMAIQNEQTPQNSFKIDNYKSVYNFIEIFDTFIIYLHNSSYIIQY